MSRKGNLIKQKLFLVAVPLALPPSPSSLVEVGIVLNFVYSLFFSTNFWTKIPLFFGKYCNTPVKISTCKPYRDTFIVHTLISCLK